MKKIYFSTMIACLLAFVGCQNEELVNETTDTGNGKKVTLTANIAGATDSRVALTPTTDENGKPIVKVNWRDDSDNLEIFKVYNDQSECGEFTQTQGNNFEGTLPNGANRAYYGYGENRSYDLSAQDGTLNEDCILMQADMSQNSSKITFKHQTAILRVDFQGVNNQDVTKIVMDNVHTGSSINPNSITIEPASLGYFYIFLPIVNEGGYGVGHTFNFTVTASDTEYTGSLTIPENMSIVAGKLYTAKLSIIIPYVTFRAVSKQTLELKQIITEEYDDNTDEYVSVHKPYPGSGGDRGCIEYLVENSNEWKKLEPGSQVYFGGNYGDLRLRGKSPYGTLQAQIVFEKNNNTLVDCSGDIRTLVDWKHHKTAGTSNAIFQGLFKDCSVLTSAPELPATALAPNCYYSMFVGCTRLNAAPELPAITLADQCYKSMFNGCTSLEVAPKLSATDLANECYGQMFAGCTSLKAAPELSATTLADNCYNNMFENCLMLKPAPALPATTLADCCYLGMFKNCTSLTSAPLLDAITLAEACYYDMFKGCTSLTSAPELPATTLAGFCYYGMFNGCTSLNSVTMLATDISASNCLTNWMYGVPTGEGKGTFTKHKDMTSLSTGANGIPSGWTVQDYEAPGEGI